MLYLQFLKLLHSFSHQCATENAFCFLVCVWNRVGMCECGWISVQSQVQLQKRLFPLNRRNLFQSPKCNYVILARLVVNDGSSSIEGQLHPKIKK